MSSKEKKSKSSSVVKKNNQSNQSTQNIESNECPKKEGDNCLVPGVYSDSAPIGGGG
jgi:hypothetical protein